MSFIIECFNCFVDLDGKELWPKKSKKQGGKHVASQEHDLSI